MSRFSYKVNKQRHTRDIRRHSIRQLIAPSNNSFDGNSSTDNEEQLFQKPYQQEYVKVKSSTAADVDHVSTPSYTNSDDDSGWISDNEYEDDTRPLYNGSSMTISNAIQLINEFNLNVNLDKQKINKLLRLIKSLLPSPNLLPSTWKSINKSLQHVSSTSTTFLCTDCYYLCNTTTFGRKICVNSNCITSFRQRQSTEIIELVRFDIRTQIQSIMNRNSVFMNKSHLFPASDVCFGEQYKQMSIMNNNKISLIVHADGAPLVRSSKQSIWPCFASITELPPPIREYQCNIIILALWSSRKKPDVNVFLEQTVNDLSILIQNGTSIFIENCEYKIQLATQFFVSDLPAKALFCCTTNFNGYSACTFCCSKGEFSFCYLLNI
jgi:hypothetical protein